MIDSKVDTYWLESTVKVNAIRFAEWISGEGYQQYDSKETWIAPHNNLNVYTTEQPYDKFYQEISQ